MYSKYNHFCVQILDISGYKRGLHQKNLRPSAILLESEPFEEFLRRGSLVMTQSFQLCCPEQLPRAAGGCLHLEIQFLGGPATSQVFSSYTRLLAILLHKTDTENNRRNFLIYLIIINYQIVPQKKKISN